MEKEKISMKGGKYPQDFQEKLMTLSLNADIMSSMVLKDIDGCVFVTWHDIPAYRANINPLR